MRTIPNTCAPNMSRVGWVYMKYLVTAYVILLALGLAFFYGAGER